MGGTQRTKEKTTHMMNDPFIFKADIKTIIPFRLIIAVQETLCE